MQPGDVGWRVGDLADAAPLVGRNEYMAFGHNAGTLGTTARRTLGGESGCARECEFRSRRGDLCPRNIGDSGVHGPSNSISCVGPSVLCRVRVAPRPVA